MTFTGVPKYVEQGIAVGIGIQDRKPKIHINLSASKAEGAEFSSQLLKLAEIVDQKIRARGQRGKKKVLLTFHNFAFYRMIRIKRGSLNV